MIRIKEKSMNLLPALLLCIASTIGFASQDISVDFDELRDVSLNSDVSQGNDVLHQMRERIRGNLNVSRDFQIPQDYSSLVTIYSSIDEAIITPPNEIVKLLSWDEKWAGEASMDIYNNIFTNNTSFIKEYFIDDFVKDRVEYSALVWIGYLKKDSDTRKILYDRILNASDNISKSQALGMLLINLPKDDIYDFVKDVMSKKNDIGEFDEYDFLHSCNHTLYHQSCKRNEIVNALYVFLRERISKRDFLPYEKNIAYHIGERTSILSERKAILKEAAEYYKDKPEFENELKEVKNRIREIEKQEFKIWFRKRWWVIVLSLVFVAGGIVFAVWRRKI